MKYIDEFRDGATARKLAQAIAREVDPGRRYHIMEFCGGHTHAIARYGIADLLPANVRLIHGCRSGASTRRSRSRSSIARSCAPTATRCACRLRSGSRS
jgi:hydrogenase expression/formation protein HypD